MKLVTPGVIGNYDVSFGTYNGIREAFIDKNQISIMINDTYGVNKDWRAHPIKSPITLKAG